MVIPSMSTANSVRYRPPEYIELKALARSESTYGGISSTSSLLFSAADAYDFVELQKIEVCRDRVTI